MNRKKIRRFAVVQKPGYHEWSADYVMAVIAQKMLYEDLSEKEIEEIADRLGCRIAWAGPDGRVWAW